MAGRIVVESVGVTEALTKNDARMEHLADTDSSIEHGTDLFYEQVRSWYDSAGNGTWPPLAPSTIARKEVVGYADPAKALYAEGNLEASATSASGPYSFMQRAPHGILLGVDWQVGGWQIPVVHFYGTQTAGRGRNTVIPARPIWPDEHSTQLHQIISGIADLIMKGI